ncbi:uncharacterized protein [Nicotiana sylvestris]|uniref:uncharacterized protein n=1 Tax=Nicotiana sylvestris TaxID=4096 RepID=UPI00388CC63C
MSDTSSACQSRANVPQGDLTVTNFHKELHYQGQAIVEMTTTMNQLAKAQLQQLQNPRQVNAIEGVNMFVNKKRQRRQQNQGNSEQFDDDCDGLQNDGYDKKNEEVQYLGQISQSLNTRPKGALPSDTVVNLKGGNNRIMAVTTRSGRGGDVNASKQKQILDDDVELQEDEVPLVVEDAVDEKIILEDDAKPSLEHQRRLNEAVQEVLKKEMLDRLAGRAFYYFLDGYSRYNQILIALEDQEKTTFTCPYSTFAFSRMTFGLCNAPATFQRCMIAIFTDMVEDILEVFMDDFSVVGDLFD